MDESEIIELAPLPRDQIGPFLLLGLDKNADAETVEAHWAERLKWARRQLLNIPLEDINWARDLLRDADRRLRADVASLNADVADGLLVELEKKFGTADGSAAPRWQPLDRLPDLAHYEPSAEMPDAAAIRAAVVLPDIPEEYPAAIELLRAFVCRPVDTWEFELPADTPAGPRSENPPL